MSLHLETCVEACIALLREATLRAQSCLSITFFPRPKGRVQQCAKWVTLSGNIYEESLSLTEPICKSKGTLHRHPACSTLKHPQNWVCHASQFVRLLKDNDSWKNVKFFTTTISYFPAFISTQADRVKKLSFSEPAFLCSGTDFAMLMKRQRFSLSSPCSQNKHSNLRGIQKRLRNYGVTWCDLISRGEADLHPLCYSITADQYIRQSICINTSMKVWQLQSGFPW